MPDGADKLETLFARAESAIKESWRLVEENRDWQRAARSELRLMVFRSRFRPKTWKFYTLLDFVQQPPNNAFNHVDPHSG